MGRTISLREIIADIRIRSRQFSLDKLRALVEEARAEFHCQKSCPSDAQSEATAWEELIELVRETGEREEIRRRDL